mmetsp:Transcript_9050/g.23471  ORF Transcript_9050/g.23471 Transcript_9050/m.23471 type:complete len:509 (-) Transcript_9050:179-1705(-)
MDAREPHLQVSLQPISHEEDAESAASRNGGRAAANPIFEQMEVPWANSKAFVVDFGALALLSCICGLLAYAYGYVTGDLLSDWLSATAGVEYPTAYLTGERWFGPPLWIPLCWAFGTLVGILKVAVGLDTFDSFLVEIRKEHCSTMEGLKTFVCCIASLLSGACMGPEAGIAAAGGAIGTFLSGAVSKLGPEYAEEQVADERRRLYVLSGICAAFATMMPAPWVALLICVECAMLKADDEGKKLKLFGHKTLFMLGIVATLAWTVRYAVKEIPLMPDLALMAKTSGVEYDNWMPFKAILLGAIGAASALVYFIIGALCKVLMTKIGKQLERAGGKPARIIGLASIAGLMTGVLGYLVPMSLASGKEALIPTVFHASNIGQMLPGAKELTAVSLLWIALAKTVSYSFAAAGGMVGGPFFPILYIGVVLGEMCARIPIDWGVLPAALTVPAVMVAVPGAVFPIPFTLVAMPLSYFHLGPRWCVPILAAVITSYTLVVGAGVAQKLAGGGR